MIYSHQQFTSALEVIEINANLLFAILHSLDDIRHHLEGSSVSVSSSDYGLDKNFDLLLHMLDKMKLESAKSQVERITENLKMGAEGYDIAQDLKDLRNRIEDDLKHPALYCCTSREKQLVEEWEKEFDDYWIKGDPDIANDLEEASKCLAFGCYTACVFHLTRPMEAAVREAGKQMGVTVEEKSGGDYLFWGMITNNMQDRLDKLKKSDPSEHEKWVQIHGMFECVRVAWRNEVMHPRRSYGGREAEKIFDSVKTFMNHLAEKL